MDKWELFEQYRTRLHRVATRIVRSADDADDIVQEMSLRWMRVDLASVRAPEGWMVTVVTRLAVDHVRRVAKQQRLTREFAHAQAAASDSVGTVPDETAARRVADAFFLLRFRLTPTERLAFVLREVFGCEYEEVARALRKSEVACRQIVHRARTRLREPVCSIEARRSGLRELAERFTSALETGNREAILATLNHHCDEVPHAPAPHARPFDVRLERLLHSAA